MKKILFLLLLLIPCLLKAQLPDISSMREPEFITVSPTSISGMGSSAGALGSIVGWTMTWHGWLGTTVTIGPLTGFVFSTDSSTFATSVTYSPSGVGGSKRLYVAMASSNTVGSYNGNIAMTTSSPGFVTVYIPVTGTTVVGPTMSVSPTTITLTDTSGQSGAPQPFIVTFSGLTGNITQSIPTNTTPIEVSIDGGSSYFNTSQTFNTGSPKTLLARVNSSAAPGAIVDTIQLSTPGAVTIKIPVGGTVVVPTLGVSPTSISGFTSVAGVIGTAQTYALTGTYLQGNVTVTAPSGYSVSLNGSSWSGSQTVTPSGGNVSQTIYVALAAANTANTYTGNVTNASTGATSKSVAVSGTTSGATVFRRALFDFGGYSGGIKNGFPTPISSTTNPGPGLDSNGRWWNNFIGLGEATNELANWIVNPVDTNNVAISGFSMSANQNFSGSTDSSLNTPSTGGNVLHVIGTYPNSYPWSAAADCMYMTTGRTVQVTIHLTGASAGLQCDLKIWGSKSTGAAGETVQFKRSTDASYTLSYDAYLNTTYNNGNQTLTNLTDGTIVYINAPSGTEDGFISLFDVIIHS